MPSLQLHQLRVAGVAQIICENIDVQVDSSPIIMACLLHDMGNIIKFKLDLFPEFLEPEGLDYWKKVKKDFHSTYGDDEHVATMSIVKGSVPLWRDRPYKKQRVLELIEAIGFSNAKLNYESTDFGNKIAAYADTRVKPHGVTSMKERLADGRARFKLNTSVRQEDEGFFEEMAGYLKKIEDQIFSHMPFKPSEITEKAVQEVIRSKKLYIEL
ncbi:MAG: HD domain-containing protein [bacterium]|nr:HD domain-containing protein [bacterium]